MTRKYSNAHGVIEDTVARPGDEAVHSAQR